MHRVRRGLGGDALHALQIGVERRRERHRQRADEGLGHHHRVAGELEAARTEDGARRLFGTGHRVRLGEERELQVEVDELLAVVHRLEHDVPVGLALLQVGQEARHVAGGVRGGAGGLEEGPVAGGLGVEHVHAQREQERAGVLQRALVEVADQAAGVPQREARREGAHRHQAKLGLQVGGRVGQADALAVDAQARGPVDHLVAQLAPVVVGERDGVAGLPVRVEQRGDPVDQVLRRPRTRREAGGVQRGPDPVAQQQQLLQAREILRAAGKRDADHQPVVAEQVTLCGEQRCPAALQVVPGTTPGHGAVDVGVPAGAAEGVELRDHVVGQTQVRVARQRRANGGARVQVELDARAGRRGRVERGQHARHLFVGAGLRTQFQAEAQRVEIDEDLAVRDPGAVRQPLGERGGVLAARCGAGLGHADQVRGLRALQHGLQIGQQAAPHRSGLLGRATTGQQSRARRKAIGSCLCGRRGLARR